MDLGFLFGGKEDTHVVDEPNQADDEETEAVEAKDEAVWGFCIFHRVLLEFLGLLQEEAQDQQDRGENDTDTEAGAPDCAVMLIIAGGGNNIRNESANNEPLFTVSQTPTEWRWRTHPVDHGVGEEDEPGVPRAGLELTRRLGASHTASWVLSADADTNLSRKTVRFASSFDNWGGYQRTKNRHAVSISSMLTVSP
jgi:hypothetical protein